MIQYTVKTSRSNNNIWLGKQNWATIWKFNWLLSNWIKNTFQLTVYGDRKKWQSVAGWCGRKITYHLKLYLSTFSFPGGSDGKESACNAGDLGSVLGLGRSPGEGNGCPLQYSGLENSQKNHKESDTTEWLSLSLLVKKK